MIIRALILLVALPLAACMTPTTEPQRLPAGAWTLDQDHASVTWQVRHTGLSLYTARFDEISARLDFDPAMPEAAQLTAIIEADSLSTGDRVFDAVLAEDWLNASQHPQLVFRSERIEVSDQSHGRAIGSLTMNGRTHDAVLEIEFYGGAYNMLVGTDVIGFSGDMIIDRTDFGIGNLPAAIVGHDVHVHIEAEFLRQGEPHD
jgi:polyisoprenoid-binding protein YceI